MTKIYSIVILIFFASTSYAQFFGNEESLSLSQGAYSEVQDKDSIVQVGSALYNIRTSEVIGITYVQDTISRGSEEELMGRWLAVDPLALKYSYLSPYNFVNNRPILFIDPDGKKFIASNSGADVFFVINVNKLFPNNASIVKVLLASSVVTNTSTGETEYSKVNTTKLFFATLFVGKETRNTAKAYARTINSANILKLEGKSSGTANSLNNKVVSVLDVVVDTKSKSGRVETSSEVETLTNDGGTLVITPSTDNEQHLDFSALFVSLDNYVVAEVNREMELKAIPEKLRKQERVIQYKTRNRYFEFTNKEWNKKVKAMETEINSRYDKQTGDGLVKAKDSLKPKPKKADDD